jgi:UPF0755 protein
MRTLRRLLLLLIVLALLAVGGLFMLVQVPYRGFSDAVVVEFPKGTGSAQIAATLEQQGVIRNRWVFTAARLLRLRARLQAGEYKFSEAASPWTVVGRLVRGDVFFYEVTVPEGSNMFDIAGIVNEGGVIPGAKFLALARDSSLIRDLDPQAPSLEGYLFPATYRYTKATTPKALVHEMVARFRRAWSEVKPAGGGAADPHRIVTLASLVEKETAQPSERPLIAAVFTNRLRRGMTLDCDPTTIYAAKLEERFRGTIHQSDLASVNPYNTYRHAGLPPGPIANPGLAALKAAANPAESNFIFFVARPDHSGAHHFSSSMAEHSRAVADYRRGQRSN